jgi:hypothetical protein
MGGSFKQNSIHSIKSDPLSNEMNVVCPCYDAILLIGRFSRDEKFDSLLKRLTLVGIDQVPRFRDCLRCASLSCAEKAVALYLISLIML